MDVQDGVMVGPGVHLKELTCYDCGGMVKWEWRQKKERWESRHRCDHQDVQLHYIARPVVFKVELVGAELIDDPPGGAPTLEDPDEGPKVKETTNED